MLLSNKILFVTFTSIVHCDIFCVLLFCGMHVRMPYETLYLKNSERTQASDSLGANWNRTCLSSLLNHAHCDRLFSRSGSGSRKASVAETFMCPWLCDVIVQRGVRFHSTTSSGVVTANVSHQAGSVTGFDNVGTETMSGTASTEMVCIQLTNILLDGCIDK